MSLIKKVFLTFKNIHFQSLVGNGVMAVFGMVTIAILYRALSLREVGIYIFFMSILGLIDTLRSGFLTTAYIKFYSGTTEQRAKEDAGSAWLLALCITGFSISINLIALLFSSFITNEGMLLFLKYFSLISLSTLPSFMTNLSMQGEKRFDRLLWLRLTNQVLFTGTVIVLIFIGKSTLLAIILTYMFANLATSLGSLLIGWSKIQYLGHWSKTTFKDLFHFGKYSMATGVSSNLFNVTDTFFINFYLGPSALAVYNIGGKLLQIVEIPLLSFAASGMPSLSSFYNQNLKEDMIYVMKKMVGMLSIVIFFLAIIVFFLAEPAILLIGGSKYLATEAPNLFRMFMCFAILYPMDRFFSLTIDVIHKPKINFYKILVMLAVNLIGDFVGVSLLNSIYGIAMVNILSILVSIAITYPVLNRYSKFSLSSIYVVGYNELVSIIKNTYKTLFSNKKIVSP